MFKFDPESKQGEEASSKPKPSNLTRSQRKVRARGNWTKLRNHVRNMRFKLNFLAYSNDEAEMTKKMMGYDIGQPIPETDSSPNKSKSKPNEKSCTRKFVILPHQSVLKRLWDSFVQILLLYGYFRNMRHIAFDISKKDSEVQSQNEDSLIDVVFSINMGLNFITAY